mmetsp:Transcript_27990/g.38869  ORF Transcript_27990/g.38869 Transcript_27990/m.38869 type:complete len:103 (-) Transcript_27990:1491-1799(-)
MVALFLIDGGVEKVGEAREVRKVGEVEKVWEVGEVGEVENEKVGERDGGEIVWGEIVWGETAEELERIPATEFGEKEDEKKEGPSCKLERKPLAPSQSSLRG